jgi:S1-C subfamily serine protease
MPLEFNVSPQFGLINGLESRFGERFFPCTYMRTSIPAGPGDGGSAYLDINGKLLGIQVGSLPDVGSSYILPSRAALRIRDDLLFSGEVTYGWIGFEVDEDVSIEMGERIFITEIFANTPAKSAGLLPGDLLVKVGDYSVSNLDDLRNAMFYTRVGQIIDVRIVRDNQTLTKSVRLAERPGDEPLQIITPAKVPNSETMSPLKKEN